MTTTRPLKFWQGVNQALHQEMERDEKVVLVGEDVGGPGGPYGVTRNLRATFGPNRVRDTPISESTIAGLGVGAAAVGLRPVVELMFFDFCMLAMDQIVNQAAKYRYFTGRSLPFTIRTMSGSGGSYGAQHCQSFEAWFAAVPGLTVVMPSNARDAKGLLKSAIRSDDPTLVIETFGLLTARRDTPVDEDFLVPLGVAETRRTGDDVTVVATGRMVDRSLEAAERAAADGVSAEVIDPRTIAPLDRATIVESVSRTGRLVVVQEAPGPFSVAAEVCALAVEECFDRLRAAPVRLCAEFANVPTPQELVEARVPGVDAIHAALLTVTR
ncbi:pyruvate dehydrogenase E1 component subunit beta [Pseudonocardia sulfidoxydans NBRC 16205]|uniref:Pyruvate dehydrogenase E1 component subunit beta n=1 Tax=Pseudonocardia sulfidoxydans NBRC 16205 TaxID=1223511 RepID=A0A511DB52_9PSEU|nr:transketolase C-terminal domain-containing protein [Pseudonocardia sulfidoxydans]GEL21797.1 pyruvate dehydrogenase E1 component subunit beta [Pseudonocardia sulfidoxydans NBRC 16205]